MATTQLNIRADEQVTVEAERIFQQLGLNMATAIDLFLRASIQTKGMPFPIPMSEGDVPNDLTMEAIEEGRRIACDPTVTGYRSMEALRQALEA